jgi:hypothetical protein
MRPYLVRLASPLVALVCAAEPLRAQDVPPGTVLHVTPYAGVMVFGSYLTGPVGTSLTNAPGAIYGTQLGLSVAPSISLIGNIGYTSGDIRVGIPFLGGVSVGHSSMLIYDGGIQLDLPVAKRASVAFLPFVQAGVGAIRYEIDQSLLHTTATNAVVNVGAGADLALGRGVALRLMAKDYVGKFDFKEATSFDLSSSTAHSFAFSAGVRLDF